MGVDSKLVVQLVEAGEVLVKVGDVVKFNSCSCEKNEELREEQVANVLDLLTMGSHRIRSVRPGTQEILFADADVVNESTKHWKDSLKQNIKFLNLLMYFTSTCC